MTDGVWLVLSLCVFVAGGLFGAWWLDQLEKRLEREELRMWRRAQATMEERDRTRSQPAAEVTRSRSSSAVGMVSEESSGRGAGTPHETPAASRLRLVKGGRDAGAL